jgi:hypothetical protein
MAGFLAITASLVPKGWGLFGGELLVSVVFLLSGLQDMGPRPGFAVASAFFASIAIVVFLIVSAVAFRLWAEALVGVMALCFEAWLIRRWWGRGHSI